MLYFATTKQNDPTEIRDRKGRQYVEKSVLLDESNYKRRSRKITFN